MEEKFGPEKSGKDQAEEDDDEESSSNEEEDDDAILATGALDDEVNATLKALRSKDPKIYDQKSTFYTIADDDGDDESEQQKAQDKAVHLRDYHRENLLRGNLEPEEAAAPLTYAQEQDNLKRSIVKEMHAAINNGSQSNSENDEDGEKAIGFLKRKAKPVQTAAETTQESLKPEDVASAEKDPEGFLSKFLDSRGWVSHSGTNLHAFESDDDEDAKADEFEQAYNLRFENPQAANEKLVSHARDAATKYSVRQDPVNKRKRARDAERAKKEEAKSEVAEEKSRLRKLRLQEAEEKVKRIKEAAGLGKRALQLDEWQDFLTADWDDQRWETEMARRFGDDYYAEKEHLENGDGEGRSSKAKKPKWNDDIDIKDLVPDFDDKDEAQFSLSEDDSNAAEVPSSSKKSKKRKQEKEEQKHEARKERRKLERLVGEQLDVDFALDGPGKHGPQTRFKYRETSPLAFGMTAKDILLASDSQLNQHAGLKKLAAFRDADKKRKDKKSLAKKAKLRQWRKETFGDENGPRTTLQDLIREAQGDGVTEVDVPNPREVQPDIREGTRRKRSKKKEAAA